ncbi:MAG: hypothetical protein ACRDZW_09845 [Acidimicrobiales bacterium]
MAARILDTTPAFENFARTAFLDPPEQREGLWRERYEGVHPEVFAAFYAGQPDQSGRAALVRELSRIRQLAKEAGPLVAGIIEDVEPKVAEVLGVTATTSSPQHVLMVGPHTTNALVGRLDGEVTLFHCLEWFFDEDGNRVLVAHEDAHAWHELALGGEPPREDAAWLAFSEGVAIAASRLVVPGRPEADYFWYGYGGFEEWLPWCREHRAELVERFAAGLDDAETGETFFGGGLVEGRWRTGYFVADLVVTALGRSLPELVALPVDEARATVRKTLADL